MKKIAPIDEDNYDVPEYIWSEVVFLMEIINAPEGYYERYNIPECEARLEEIEKQFPQVF